MEKIIESLKSKGLECTEVDLDRYFQYLEDLRVIGVTNMFGASPYLASRFTMTVEDAGKILGEWMRNYEYLSHKFNWR